MKFQSNCNCNRLHLHVINPMSGLILVNAVCMQVKIVRLLKGKLQETSAAAKEGMYATLSYKGSKSVSPLYMGYP